jgi:hypothetical protein
MLDEGVQIEVAPNRAGAVIMTGNQVMRSFGGIHCMTLDEGRGNDKSDL